MDSQAFDALQRRVAKLERRLAQVVGLAMAAVLALVIVFTMNVAGGKAFAQTFRFEQFKGAVTFFRDKDVGIVCYSVSNATLSCVR